MMKIFYGGNQPINFFFDVLKYLHLVHARKNNRLNYPDQKEKLLQREECHSATCEQHQVHIALMRAKGKGLKYGTNILDSLHWVESKTTPINRSRTLSSEKLNNT